MKRSDFLRLLTGAVVVTVTGACTHLMDGGASDEPCTDASCKDNDHKDHKAHGGSCGHKSKKNCSHHGCKGKDCMHKCSKEKGGCSCNECKKKHKDHGTCHGMHKGAT